MLVCLHSPPFAMPPDVKPPLTGRHILVTHPLPGIEPAEGTPFEARLAAWGAHVSHVPLVEVGLTAFDWRPTNAYDWVFFTSKNAVRAFYESALAACALLKDAQIAAVGPTTAEAVSSRGGKVAFVSPRYDAQSAAQSFCETFDVAGQTILWPCGNLAHPQLAHTLTAAGALVAPLTVYETRLRQALTPLEQACFDISVDLLVFTSPSAVEAFAGLRQTSGRINASTAAALVACLGPKTAQAALERLGRVDIQPESYTLEALAQEIRQFDLKLKGER